MISLGQDIINQLRQSNSNLERSHELSFYFYFPTRGDAEKCANELTENGFAVQVDVGAGVSKWLCLATTSMIINVTELDLLGDYFTALSERLGGIFDGWESNIVKDS